MRLQRERNYGPFHTPSVQGVGTDASRETAVSVLGIGAFTATLFAAASLAVRGLAAIGRITAHPSTAVRLAIIAFAAGLFTVLWGTFFLPLLGNGPGMLWGSNFSGDASLGMYFDSRYANVGYYLGVLGFVALTPVLGLILPLAVWRASTITPARAKLRRHLYLVGTATTFTLVTAPGPFLHNVIAGAGTPLANLAARTFGENEAEAMRAMHAHPQSSVTEGILQLGVGLPVYLTCTWVALHFIRAAVTLSRQRPRRRISVEQPLDVRR